MKKWLIIGASLFLIPLASLGSDWMLEVDPIAYAAKGYSVHLNTHFPEAGFIIDLGVFAMDIPESFEKNKDFDTKFNGYGIKFNYTGNDPDGFFIGFSGGESHVYALEKDSQQEAKDLVSSLGVQMGYRLGKKGWYIQPWIGIDYSLKEIVLSAGGKEYKQDRIQFFPTVHVGYQF